MKLPDGFTFDPETHTYAIGGREVPSVTRILEDLGFIDTRWYRPEDAERGTAIHEMTASLDKGLPTKVEDGSLAGYIRSYLRWKEFWNVQIVTTRIEERIYSKRRGYAGTCDRGRLTYDGHKKPLIMDLKTGRPASWHELQLTGYGLAYNEASRYRYERGILVYLNEDGKIAHTVDVSFYSENVMDWLSILRAWHRRQKR